MLEGSDWFLNQTQNYYHLLTIYYRLSEHDETKWPMYDQAHSCWLFRVLNSLYKTFHIKLQMGGMYLLLEGVLSSLMGFRDDLIYRLAAIQVIGGVISLFIYIDYSLFRHFVLCVSNIGYLFKNRLDACRNI